MEPSWDAVRAALDDVAQVGSVVDVWLRDDDAVEPTPALARLTALCERHGLPVLLACIPKPAQPSLARLIDAHPILAPVQHGYAHTNHAPAGERARELGGLHPIDAVLGDLAQGRARLTELFGARLLPVLVPPWNRVDAALLPALPALGFTAISTFGPAGPETNDLPALNATIDIIDWRGGRICRPHDRLVTDLLEQIRMPAPVRKPIGLLTHHLVHDEAAWSFLDQCLEQLASHAAVRFSTAEALLARGPWPLS